MRIRVEPIKIKGGMLFDTRKLSRAIDNALDGAALGAKVDFDTTTRTWNNRPTFLIRRTAPGERKVYTTDLIYHFVSGGTRPHKIRAKNGPSLGFYATGFRPKSRRRWLGSNKGRRADKDFIRPVEVNHPGTEAREYPEAVVEKWNDKMPQVLQRAIDAEV